MLPRLIRDKEGTPAVYPSEHLLQQTPSSHPGSPRLQMVPIQSDPSQRNQSLRCDYHIDHGHETNRCRSLKFMVERLIRVSHLRRYVRETVCGAEAAPTVERIAASIELSPEPRSTINYILGGPTDDQYQYKCLKKRFLRATTVQARVNTIHIPDSSRAIQPIDGPISFPPIN